MTEFGASDFACAGPFKKYLDLRTFCGGQAPPLRLGVMADHGASTGV